MPTEDINEGKIYCIRDTSSTAQDNNYIEYAYINNKWEKVGEFQAEPDLSGYARLDSPKFTGNAFANSLSVTNFIAGYVNKNDNSRYFRTLSNTEASDNKTYNTSGGLSDIGDPENFVFTLEDGTKVTKSIRVISTTSQAGA